MNEVSSCMAKVSAARKETGSPQRVLIALSGGADSVALFCILKELAHQEQFQIAAVHVHHGLRNTADRDARFCQALCEHSGVPFFIRHVHLKGTSENEAREARFQAFADVYSEWNADAIALAHHSGDQAETVLMHLLRGSGSRGMAGMAVCSEFGMHGTSMKLFRPLLGIRKETLVSIAIGMHGSFCHDETNDSDLYTRNYLRLQIMPKLSERMPGFEEALGRTAGIMRAEDDFMNQLAKYFLASYGFLHPPVPFLEYEPFRCQHLALRRRIMQCFLTSDEPYDTINKAAEITAGISINLKHGWHITADSQHICLVRPEPVDCKMHPLQVLAASNATGDGRHAQRMPMVLYEKCTLRYRKPGDYLQPFGMQGKKSLQDYLVDKKISEPMRDYIPLLCIENEVIWVIGVGPSEKVREKNGEEQIFLSYPGRLPFEKTERGNTDE